jgi:type IV pilus biogenesis protein CpaD/CtpE
MASKLNLIGCALLALAGCSSSPRIDNHFGEAVRANLSAQVANPAASNNANPATGIDGHAARAAQERYEKSFTRQAENKQTLLIGTSQ